MKIDKNSRGTVALVYLICLICIFLVLRFIEIWWVKGILVLFFCWFGYWQTMFHMVPDRESVGDSHNVCAVADGRVVISEIAFEPEVIKGECRQVSVYMDFWDFHANFWPLTGRVSHYNYTPGRHLLAFKPKASIENEHTCVLIENEDGKQVLFKQLAGGFARRIVCYASPGMEVSAGKQCGIIKFGSRIDYFFPADAKIVVSVGDIVRANETLIAKL